MCPGCVGSALLLLSGASSAGGLAALKLRSLGRIRAARQWVGAGTLEARDHGQETAAALQQPLQTNAAAEAVTSSSS